MGKKSGQEGSSNVANVGSMVNSAFQQASPGASQTLSINSPEVKADADRVLNDVLAGVDQLAMDDKQKGAVRAEAETIQAQMKLETPKPLVIKACFEGIKAILLGAVGAEGRHLGAAIVDRINDLLSRL